MVEPLTHILRRFEEDPEGTAASFEAPVLLFEPPNVSPKTFLGTYQLHAIPKSGYQLPMLGPFAQVLALKPRKEGSPRVTLGRTAEQDLVIDHPSVSRFHAWFEWGKAGRGWQVAHNGSRNGTVVNERRVSARKLVSLGEASILGFGDVNVQFYVPEAFLRFLKQTATRSDS
jgi:hypothetical protein